MSTVWLSSFLSFWLLVTIARQVFDLIGRLWIPVAFNLVQLVCLITGLFGVCQRRLSLLVVFSVSCLFAIAQNVLISLWYLGVFGDRTRPVLSGGLPYSFSFWLRYTPGCASHFDLTRSRWVQSPCPVPYYQLEVVVAILNILLALSCIGLTIQLILWIRREKRAVPKTPLPSAYSQLGVDRGKVGALPEAPSSLNDISSGYMNSSYEEVNKIVHSFPQSSITPSPPRPVPKADKNRKKKMGKPRPQSMPQPDVYSSEDMRKEDFYTKPVKTNKAGGGRFKKQQELRRQTVSEDKRPSLASSANTTSLVSFDPKSGTLLRVREHVDSDEDYQRMRDEYGRHELPVDVGSIYERIRPREELLSSARLSSSTRLKNTSQDSVPSTLAPVLVSPTEGSSCDSGVPSSSYDQWPPVSERAASEQFTSPGIRLSSDYAPTPGIRLSSAIAMEQQRRSSFQLQIPQESRRVIGHYHSVNEFALTDSEDNAPVIKGRSLLV